MSKKKIKRPQQYKKPKDRTFKEWWQDQSEGTRKGIVTGCIAVLAVIVLLLVYYWAIYEDGSLKVKDNAIVGIQDNWLVGQRDSGKHSKYYHLADVAVPEGYTVTDGASSSGLQQAFAYEKDGITLNVNGVSRGVKDMVDSVYPTISAFVGEEGSITEVQDYKSALGDCQYFSYTTATKNEDETTVYSRSLVLYAPCDYKDCCILVSASARGAEEAALPAAETLLAEAETALNGVTVIKR